MKGQFINRTLWNNCILAPTEEMPNWLSLLMPELYSFTELTALFKVHLQGGFHEFAAQNEDRHDADDSFDAFGVHGMAVAWALSMIGTPILLLIVDKTIGLRLSAQDEQIGLDQSQHGEAGYELEVP